MTTTTDWALGYARAGWRVFPVIPGQKRPCYAGWPKDATTDPALIRQYWNAPDRNIGIVCGEAFDAWDIEGAHLAAFSAWLYRTGAMPADPPIAATGRGGVHILTAPTGVDGSRNLYLDGVHIGELKSRGGFIVVCPSEVIYDERAGDYVWVNWPPRLTVPDATPGLLGLLERPATVRRTLPTPMASADDAVAVLGRLCRAVVAAGEGRRNNYLYWALRRAIEEGIPARHAIRTLRDAAAEAGLDADETEKTIESAVGAESLAA